MTDRLCTITDCERPHEARGWCSMHYKRWKARGDPLFQFTRSPIDRLLAKTDVFGPVPSHQPHLGPCWLYDGGGNGAGYGTIGVGSHADGTARKAYVHRLAYEHFVGPIPDDLELDHLCRVPACCCPWHLEPVTHRENMQRGAAGMKRECPAGHPYDAGNTYIDKRGHRRCRTCAREYDKRRYRLDGRRDRRGAAL